MKMNNKTIRTIQIILAVIALVYFVMPDLVIGPFDDAAVAGLIASAEIVLGILQARSRSSGPGQASDRNRTSENSRYQHSENSTYSENDRYQYSEKDDYTTNTEHSHHQDNGPVHDSDNKDNEFQFFAGCNDWEAVKSRYRDLMKIYHPDAGGNEEASKKINAEYNILKERFGRK